MDSLLVTSLLDPQDDSGEELAVSKLAHLLDSDSDSQREEGLGDILKTASVMEKLAKAIESGQAQLDDDLRELFGGEEADDDIARHNKIEEDYLKVTGQPGI